MENKKVSRYSEAQNRATQKYIKANYDEMKLRLPKGAKDNIKAYIEKHKDTLPAAEQSMQGFVKAAITEKMLADDSSK